MLNWYCCFIDLLGIDALTEQLEHSYKRRAITDVTKRKLERLLEIFITIFGALSYIILKEQRILETLEPITEFYANRDRFSEM